MERIRTDSSMTFAVLRVMVKKHDLIIPVVLTVRRDQLEDTVDTEAVAMAVSWVADT